MTKIFGRKKSWKSILMSVGIVLAVVLVISLLVGLLVRKDTKEIGVSAFERGAIDDNGEYVESTTAIYTKEAFACQGLRIVPDFKANGKFQVFFYDVDNNLIFATDKLDTTYESECPEASLARVVYWPEKPADVKTADWKIGVLEVAKYAKNLTITVDAEQVEYKSSTDMYAEHSVTGKFTAADINTIDTDAAVQASEVIELDGKYDLYRIYVKASKTNASSVETVVAFGDENGKAIMLDEDGKPADGFAYTFGVKDMKADAWVSVVVEVPEDATTLRIMGPADAEYRIYGVAVK